MNKKIISAGLIAFCMTLPAMAESWPSGDYMQASKTYTGAATDTHMDGVSSGSVGAIAYYNITAGYYLPAGTYIAEPCPAGKYCSGVNTAITLDITQNQGISGDVAAGYYSTGGASTNTGTGAVAAGYYSTGGATTSTGAGAIDAGYFSTGGAKSKTPSTTDCVGSGNTCGMVAAGYYSTGGGTKSTPTAAGNGCISGKNCGVVIGGYYSTGGGTKYNPTAANNGCLSGKSCGQVSAGYYSSAGGTSATPTAAGSGCLTGKSCGQCSAKVTGYTSAAGSNSITKCYKKGTLTCSDVFSVSSVTGKYEGRSGGVYVDANGGSFYPGSGSTVPYYGSSTPTTGSLACTRYLTSNGAEGECGIDDPMACQVRGVTCNSGYHEVKVENVAASSWSSSFTGYSGMPTISTTRGWDSDNETGTFKIDYGQGKVITGIWARADSGSFVGSSVHTLSRSASGTKCGCQIQTIASAPQVSLWFEGTQTTSGAYDDGGCANVCTNTIASNGLLAVLNSTPGEGQTDLWQFTCKLDSYGLLLNPNGATSGGKIAGQTIGSDPVLATCTNGRVIGNIGTSTAATTWRSGGDNTGQYVGTNIAKASNILIGWSSTDNCTSASCLAADTCQAENQNVYYAAWAPAACIKGEGVATTEFVTVSENQVRCSRSSTAGYYCTSGAASGKDSNTSGNYTVTCDKCKTNWTSAAGSTAETNCYRSITLNKNGGSGTIKGATGENTASVTCNYNTECDFGSASGLTQTGQTFTGGWGTSPSCSGATTKFTITDTAASVVYYACKGANTITINWTGVSSVPANSGFGTVGSDNKVSSTVSYGGDVITPTAPAVAQQGQTFLGWKFVKPAQ